VSHAAARSTSCITPRMAADSARIPVSSSIGSNRAGSRFARRSAMTSSNVPGSSRNSTGRAGNASSGGRASSVLLVSLSRPGVASNTKGVSPFSAHNAPRPVPSPDVRFISATTTSTAARARISWASLQHDAVSTVYRARSVCCNRSCRASSSSTTSTVTSEAIETSSRRAAREVTAFFVNSCVCLSREPAAKAVPIATGVTDRHSCRECTLHSAFANAPARAK
jgi:hypothetical protein